MKINDFNLWSRLTFKTIAYRKNFDLTTENENVLTEYDGEISVLRLKEKTKPLIIGEYGFTTINLELCRTLDIDYMKLIQDYSDMITYGKLLTCIYDNTLNIDKYKKIVLIHNLVVCSEYRKRGVTEEFIEAIHRDFYDDKTAILALVMPFQNNPNDEDYYFNHKSILKSEKVDGVENIEKIIASKYYSLAELYNRDDTEYNEYKLFSVANRCGFNRIGDSHLFFFTPDKTIKRLKEKIIKMKKYNQ